MCGVRYYNQNKNVKKKKINYEQKLCLNQKPNDLKNNNEQFMFKIQSNNTSVLLTSFKIY